MSENKGYSPLQARLQRERKDKTLFQRAMDFGWTYAENIEERVVYPKSEALQGLINFEEHMPQEGRDATSILETLERYGSHATVASNGGRYFGFVTGASIPAATAASQMASFWDQNAAMQVMSPVVAKLEQVCEEWLKELFDLPGDTVAGLVSGTSVANLCAIAAARYRILQRQGWDVRGKGVFGAPSIRVVCGEQVHASVIKALLILGFGLDALEKVPVDGEGRMLSNKLPVLDKNTLLILQAGNVNSGSFDPFDKIIPQAREAGAWVHIDGAFGLWVKACASLSHLCRGVELADSWAVDGHKTLNTPYDCGIVLCADKDALQQAMQSNGAYLMQGDERDGMIFTPEMSRRSRAIEIWASLKSLGKQGLDEMIATMHLRTSQLADALKHTKGIKQLNFVHFNQLMLACETDELTLKTLVNLQESGTCWAGSSSWFGKKVIRISVCAWPTSQSDIEVSANAIQKALLQANK